MNKPRSIRVHSTASSFVAGICLPVFIALASGTAGCANAPPANDPAAAGAKAPGAAQVGDVTTCPISKETFTVTATSPKADYKGKTYYFCCPHCAEKFKANPDAYVPSAG